MSVELIIGLASVAGVTLGGVLTYFATRGRTQVEAIQAAQSLTLETRRDTLEDRDNLITILQGSVNDVREEMKGYRLEVNALRVEVGEVRTHNNALVTFVYKMLAVFRKYDLEHEIPDPRPEGIDFD